MRTKIVVVKTKDGISCLPKNDSKKWYYDRYDVVCFINKLWNPYHVTKIKKYFNVGVK